MCAKQMSEDLKKFSKCETECLKSNFHIIKKMSDGLLSQCISFRKICYKENLVKIN